VERPRAHRDRRPGRRRSDPCWFGGGNFVYRADVTPFITRGDTYLVWRPTGAAGSRDYSDPWGAPGPVPPLCEGATLVVVYTNGIEPMGVTYIYDAGLAGTMFLADPGLMYGLGGFFYPRTEARWINVGADGQTGIGYPDLDVMGLETTTFAGAPIADRLGVQRLGLERQCEQAARPAVGHQRPRRVGALALRSGRCRDRRLVAACGDQYRLPRGGVQRALDELRASRVRLDGGRRTWGSASGAPLYQKKNPVSCCKTVCNAARNKQASSARTGMSRRASSTYG
jgi:hypothetical protein